MVDPKKPTSLPLGNAGTMRVMSKKWPAESHGSLVIRASPRSRVWVGNASTKYLPAAASELMWPGVPVTACATMRPRRSNRALARSPASRTTGLKAMRCRALACSLTMLMRLLQTISSSMPSMSALLRGHDATGGVDVRAPAGKNDDGGFALLDDCRSFDALAAGELSPLIDRRVDVVVLEAGLASGLRLGWCCSELGRAVARDRRPDGDQTPAHDFHINVGQPQAIEVFVHALEHFTHPGGVVVLARVALKPGSELVLLAEVAHVRAEPERKVVRLAARTSEAAACIAHELREDGIHLLPIEREQTR